MSGAGKPCQADPARLAGAALLAACLTLLALRVGGPLQLGRPAGTLSGASGGTPQPGGAAVQAPRFAAVQFHTNHKTGEGLGCDTCSRSSNRACTCWRLPARFRPCTWCLAWGRKDPRARLLSSLPSPPQALSRPDAWPGSSAARRARASSDTRVPLKPAGSDARRCADHAAARAQALASAARAAARCARSATQHCICCPALHRPTLPQEGNTTSLELAAALAGVSEAAPLARPAVARVVNPMQQDCFHGDPTSPDPAKAGFRCPQPEARGC